MSQQQQDQSQVVSETIPTAETPQSIFAEPNKSEATTTISQPSTERVSQSEVRKTSSESPATISHGKEGDYETRRGSWFGNNSQKHSISDPQ